MTRDRIIYGAVLFAMFAVCLAVYQFYFKAKLEKYAQDKQLLENLNSRYNELTTTFKSESPETVIAQYRSVVEDWRDAIGSRVDYFNDAEWREHEKPPEDVFVLRFWYGEQTRDMTFALWEKAQAQYGAQIYQRFPQDIQTMLGVPYAEQWQGYDITEDLVIEQLERLSYGISACELLLENNARTIRQVSIYEPEQSGFIGKDVEYARVGLAFSMEVEDFVELVEDMRADDHFFSIQGLKVTHPYIAMRYEPQLDIEMFLARAKPSETFLEGTVTAGGGAAAGGSGGVESPSNALGAFQSQFSISRAIDDEEPAPEPSGFAKAWRWFKRTVLFTN